MLSKGLETDMGKTMSRLKKLDGISQIIIVSKIDALYERQMIDEERAAALSLAPERCGQSVSETG